MDERYRKIVEAVDAEFARNKTLHGDRIRCAPGCSDCCYHVFPITRLEAELVRTGVDTLPEDLRQGIEQRAEHYIGARLLRGERLPCPALVDGRCVIYDYRPLMCHKFGMPLYNPKKPDRIYACELNFGDGEEIYDPDLIQIQTAIHADWSALKDNMGLHGDSWTVARAILDCKPAS